MFKKQKSIRILLASLLVLSNSLLLIPQADARIIFENDAFTGIQSEGLIIDENNDAGINPINLQLGNDGTDALLQYDPVTGDMTFSTPGGDFSLGSNNLTTTGDITTNTFTSNGTANFNGAVNLGDGGDAISINSSSWDISGTGVATGFTGITSTGGIDFSGATRLALPRGNSNPGTCTEGDAFYNTTSDQLLVCTATDTWTNAGPQDFENIYGYDADKTLTTTNQNFTINTGSADLIVDSADWNVTSSGALDATSIQSNGALTVTGTTSLNGITNIGDGGDASAISGTTVGITSNGAGNDITMTSADDISFDDLQLTGPIQLTNTATAFNATLTGGGIIDNINSFTSTASGEGASNVGVEDLGGYFTGTNVEAVLQELGAAMGGGAKVEDLTFYPEFPNSAIYPDGSSNSGTLTSNYNNTERMSYYEWSTTQNPVQDIDLKFTFPLPADFTSTGDFTFRYQTGSTTEADNDVEYYINNITDANTLCASDTSNVSTTWATGTITAATINAGCTGANALNAGDIIQITIKFYDRSVAGSASRSGVIKLNYNN